MQKISQPGQYGSVIAGADVALIGGSLAGIASAMKFAANGRSVVVVEPRTYIGREWTATLRMWVDGSIRVSKLPDWLQLCIDKSTEEGAFPPRKGIRTPLHPDRLKIALEDVLFEQDIQLIYASVPVGLETEDGRVTGVVIANKSGRQVVRCSMVLDATETALLSILAGSPVSSEADDGIYYRTLEYDGLGTIEESVIKVPNRLRIVNGEVYLYHGIRGDSHVYVEYAVRLPAANGLAADKEREIKARSVGMRLAKHLAEHVPAFAKAHLAASSFELYGPFSSERDKLELEASSESKSAFNIEQMQTPVKNVWSIFRDFYLSSNYSWLSPARAAIFGEQIAEHWLKQGADRKHGKASTLEQKKYDQLQSASRYEVRIPGTISGESMDRTWIQAGEYPILKSVDVLVVGGGSSGASASIYAAKEGVSTLLVEGNPGMGGTGTFGGVDSYWFGRRVGFAAEIIKKVDEVQESLRYKGHKWNIEAKMFALLQEAVQSGTDTLFNTITYGAVMEGYRVCGTIVATRWGPQCILSEVCIDATGDGDVAVFAGADYVYGSRLDQTVMWYSLAQFKDPGRTKNNFTSMADLGSIKDLTRAIITGRRRAELPLHDHSIYVATRESRHIAGDVTMTLTDQLLHRLWEDVINIHFSNHDVKGVSGADWVNVGLLPPNLEIEIPYRLLLPRGLDGILLAGKAMSATHDALPAIRMQSDLENIGGVVALAAAMSVQTGTPPRNIKLKALQKRLVEKGLLPENVLSRKLEPIIYNDEELERLVEQIEEHPLYEYANMRMNEVFTKIIPFAEICSVGPQVIPILQRALKTSSGLKQIHIAQALAMYESNAGVPVLIDAIMESIKGDSLPKRTADIMYVTQPPDHGAMPDVAYLLYSLAQIRDNRSIPIWERVAELIDPTEEDFKDAMLGLYYYIDAVCKGAERLGKPAAVPALLKMHNIPCIKGQQCYRGAHADYFLERRAMLELSIGRALARCGHVSGYHILITYTEDYRSLLKQQAQIELMRLTGQPAAELERTAWEKWLKENQQKIQPAPQSMRLDRVDSSDRMLRCIQ